jgi:hypothetical protein
MTVEPVVEREENPGASKPAGARPRQIRGMDKVAAPAQVRNVTFERPAVQETVESMLGDPVIHENRGIPMLRIS